MKKIKTINERTAQYEDYKASVQGECLALLTDLEEELEGMKTGRMGPFHYFYKKHNKDYNQALAEVLELINSLKK
jgi:hypothetical protein